MKLYLTRKALFWLLGACASITFTGCGNLSGAGGNVHVTFGAATGMGALLGSAVGAHSKPIGHVIGSSAGGVLGSVDVTPCFPSQPPEPYKDIQITSLFPRSGENPVIGQLVQQIQAMLGKAGYDKKLRYYRFKSHGFAVATSIEHFDEVNGSHVETGQRFVGGLSNSPPANGLVDYLRRMITGKQGQYRMFVILATNETYEYSRAPMSAAEKEQITRGGADSLSDGILNGEWNTNVRVKLLVYEFEKLAGRPAILASNPKDADWHFEKSGLQLATQTIPTRQR